MGGGEQHLFEASYLGIDTSTSLETLKKPTYNLDLMNMPKIAKTCQHNTGGNHVYNRTMVSTSYGILVSA